MSSRYYAARTSGDDVSTASGKWQNRARRSERCVNNPALPPRRSVALALGIERGSDLQPEYCLASATTLYHRRRTAGWQTTGYQDVEARYRFSVS
jgi:hypothetical protein